MLKRRKIATKNLLISSQKKNFCGPTPTWVIYIINLDESSILMMPNGVKEMHQLVMVQQPHL